MNGIRDLPSPDTRNGDPRRVGIEVECGGLDEQLLADILASELGGTVRETGQYERVVEGTEIGDIEVLLDTALRDKVESRIAKAGLALGRAVIPVEFVTEPVLPSQIPKLDRTCKALASAGATGTRDGMLLGFGVHLNVALVGMEAEDILPTLTAFALIEDWLRDRMNLDVARRAQPFVNTYPSDLVDRLCDETVDWTMDRLLSTYLDCAPDRNHALDLLPILKLHDEDRVLDAVPQMGHKAARPAWHYRLPDCRIDEADWSIGLEWNRWCAVEEVAMNTELVTELKDCWRRYRARSLAFPGRWHAVSSEILDKELSLP